MSHNLSRSSLIVARIGLAIGGCLVPPQSTHAAKLWREAETATILPFFRIQVVDEATSRGIPLVRLTTTNHTTYYTDSAGMVAFCEPELMGKSTQFRVESFGYEFARNRMFNQPETRVIPRPGEKAVLTMKRVNIAQRLYRVTGADIYRDSVLLGDRTPLTQDPSNLPVMGMDSVVSVIYRGKMFWIWGDTGISSTNLGNFKTTAAVSDLPDKGGLDPEDGVYLNFFRRDNGWVQEMVNIKHQGPIWIGGLRVCRDGKGGERLFANYYKIRGFLNTVGKGLLEFNDKTRRFDEAAVYPMDGPIQPDGHVFRHEEGGKEYFYYGGWVRSLADAQSVLDLSSYEAFTCLKDGVVFDGSANQLDRDAKGNLVWKWRKNTPAIEDKIDKLVSAKAMAPDERPCTYRDAATGKPVMPHGASIHWNAYRQRWSLVLLETFGSSWLGEIWYFEGDTPLGPWVYGRKIITHTMGKGGSAEGKRVDEAADPNAETYGFYNPDWHPEFSKDNGRVIFIEGTYTMQFSGAKAPTPRYNYNQIMYKLELDDPRLFLPVPVYRATLEGGSIIYATKEDLTNQKGVEREIAFFAPDRPAEGTVPVIEMPLPSGKGPVLTTDAARTQKDLWGDSKTQVTVREAFHALPPVADLAGAGATTAPLHIKPLYEFINKQSGERIYTTAEKVEKAGFDRQPDPIARVWENPLRFNPYAGGVNDKGINTP